MFTWVMLSCCTQMSNKLPYFKRWKWTHNALSTRSIIEWSSVRRYTLTSTKIDAQCIDKVKTMSNNHPDGSPSPYQVLWIRMLITPSINHRFRPCPLFLRPSPDWLSSFPIFQGGSACSLLCHLLLTSKVRPLVSCHTIIEPDVTKTE